jgi:hypothetical protein
MAAKPYRRRKGKNGPYIGNYRCSFNGRDINLQTKDAHEAHARARLVTKGKWPPIDAAVAAARTALDPGAPATDPEPPAEPAGESEETGGGEPRADAPSETHSPPPRESPSHDPPADLNEAARAAADETTGRTSFDEETQAEQQNGVNTELASVMSELGGGQNGADLLDGLCDGGAAFILWAERKALELGINWTLSRRGSKQRLVTKPIDDQGALMRKSLRVGLKGMAVIHFPDIATRLTPGWAIAIGMVGGAGQMLMSAALVDKEKGTVIAVADAMAQAQAAAQEPPAATTDAPPAS